MLYMYILRLRPCRRPPFVNQLTGDWKEWQDLQTSRTGSLLDRVSFLAQSGHLGPGGSILGTLGDRLGDPGILGHTPGLTWESRPGFYLILGGFWVPLGTHFGVILVTFSWFGVKQTRKMTSKVGTLAYLSKSDEIVPPQSHPTCNPIEPARADRMSAVFLKRIKKSPTSHQNEGFGWHFGVFWWPWVHFFWFVGVLEVGLKCDDFSEVPWGDPG